MQVFSRHSHVVILFAAVAASFMVSLFESNFNAYYYQIIIYIGINVMLASSLNLVNGFTGQFSLGHAGFMAIGAYTASVITSQLGATAGMMGSFIFLLALVTGGMLASFFGLLVGIPSLRLKGDYLAIVTLGFGEIIRVIIQNLEFLGGARGFTGITKHSNFFWVFAVVAILLYLLSNLI